MTVPGAFGHKRAWHRERALTYLCAVSRMPLALACSTRPIAHRVERAAQTERAIVAAV